MYCWLAFITATHPHLDHEVAVTRRVFAADVRGVFRLVSVVLSTGGWVQGRLLIHGIVSAAAPGAPFLDVAADFLPPPRGNGSGNGSGKGSGNGSGNRPPGPHGRPVAATGHPSGPHGPSKPVIVAHGGPHAVPRAPRATRRSVPGAPRTLREDLRTSPLAVAVCGWYVDRTTPAMRADLGGRHHDPLCPCDGVPGALAFGPDQLATDDDPDTLAARWWR